MKTFKIISIYIAAFIICYLGFAFVMDNIDASTWDIRARLFTLVTTAFLIMLYHISEI